MKWPESVKSEFDRDGYVHIHNFYTTAEVKQILQNVERYQRDVVPQLDTFRALYDTDASGATRSIKQLIDLDKADSFFFELLHSQKATSLGKLLLSDDLRVHTLEYFDKPPRIGKPTPPHQDGYFFCLEPNAAVTVWVALDDCDRQNGCLYYVRGSHQRPLLDHTDSGVVGFSQQIVDRSWDCRDEVALTVQAGDCLAHHAGTIHFADANCSNRHRRSFGMVYYAARAERNVQARTRLQQRLAAQRARYQQSEINSR